MERGAREPLQNDAAAPGSFRELLRVSVPLMLSAGTLSVMNAADRAMLTGWSANAIAAVTPAAMMHWTAVCIPLGTILYANTFIAQFDGAGQPKNMMASLWQALWLAVVCGLLLMLCPLLSGPALLMTDQPAGVIAEEKIYFDTLCMGCPLLMLSTALSCFYSGRRRTTVVLAVNLVSVLINFGLDYLFIFGRGGFAAMGIRGAALATLAARFWELMAYLLLISRKHSRDHFPLLSTWRPDSRLLRKYLRFGLPSGLHYFVDNVGFTAFLLILGSLSRDALAASNLAFSINGLIFIPLMGFGTAVQTLVGHHIGTGLRNHAIRTTWKAVVLAGVWSGLTAVMLYAFPELCLQPFFVFAESGPAAGSVAAILPVTAMLLQFVAVYSVFDALAVVFAASLRGAGDTLFPMVLTMVSSWCVMTLPAWLIVRSGGATVHHLWLTATAHILLMGTLMCVRFVSGRWKDFCIVDVGTAPEQVP